MSDYYDEDDDYLFFDEEPYADVDHLAEHTMPSPVWLDNEPDIDPYEIIDELVLDGEDDEYFDQQRSAKRKRVPDGTGGHTSNSTDVPSKRRKMSMAGHVPDVPISKPFQPSPIVVWRTQAHSSISYPVISDGAEAGVALLEDWRERLKGSANSPTHGVKRHSRQIALAVVVERRQKKDLGNQRLFPVENTRRGSVAKKKVANSQLQDVQSTTAPEKKADNRLRSTALSVHRPALAPKGNATTAASMKRKAPDTDDEEEDLQVDDGISARPKKRVMTETKRPSLAQVHQSASVAREPKRKASEPESEASKVRTKRSTARPKAAAVDSVENVGKSKPRSAVKRNSSKKS
ncbi:MAG: hypothetical protein Q9195_005828 [Heterodermia aff. obscurata]